MSDSVTLLSAFTLAISKPLSMKSVCSSALPMGQPNWTPDWERAATRSQR